MKRMPQDAYADLMESVIAQAAQDLSVGCTCRPPGQRMGHRPCVRHRAAREVLDGGVGPWITLLCGDADLSATWERRLRSMAVGATVSDGAGMAVAS